MKIKSKMRILLIVILVIVVCMYVYGIVIRLREKEGYKHTPLWTTIEKLINDETEIKNINDINLTEIINILFYDKTLWDKLPLSDKFKIKFKNPKGIIKKYSKYETIWSGRSYDYDKDNVIYIDCTERDNLASLITGKNITTYYTFEYILDANNQLDDLILLKEVDIDSMTAETYDVREY